MIPTADAIAAAVADEAGKELAEALDRIGHCLGQLTDEQVWWRPAEGMNSIGNLVLHGRRSSRNAARFRRTSC